MKKLYAILNALVIVAVVAWNGYAVYFWLNELLGISVVIMLGILYSLLMVVVSLGINLRTRSNSFNRCVVFPISIYAGWISVATVANISAYLSQTAFSLGLTDQIWCIIMIIIAALINVYMVTKRNMYGYGFVGIWAILAIAVRHGSTNNGLMITAIVAAVLIVISMIVSQVKRGSN